MASCFRGVADENELDRWSERLFASTVAFTAGGAAVALGRSQRRPSFILEGNPNPYSLVFMKRLRWMLGQGQVHDLVSSIINHFKIQNIWSFENKSILLNI